jgi:ubiquinone/menaquinone biosynthesis C-methylase UbiE
VSGAGREGVHALAAVGFDRGAGAYERARPSYPAEAVDAIVAELGIGPGRRVLDLAAGTGKFTRLLVPTGADLVAVEPVAGMRDALVAAVPGVEVLDGTAEALPLPDGSVDAVVCAQAWHWFDSPAALTEVRRVLRGPGTGLAVVFNIRDESVDWVRELTDVTEFTTTNRPHHKTSRKAFADEVRADGGYDEVIVSTYRNAQVLDADGLVDRAASQSNVASMDPVRRQEILDAVRRLALTHPQLAGHPTFALPYDTEVAICRRR